MKIHTSKFVAGTTTPTTLLDSISNWLESGEGRQKIMDALSQSQGAVKELNQARTVDPKLLQEPVTL